MSEHVVTAADLDAVQDVVMWLADRADEVDLETAILMSGRLTELADAIGKTKAMLDARALKLLDGQPAKIDDKVYMAKDVGKWRPNQAKIRRLIGIRSACDDNGELLTPQDAAKKAVDIAYDLFVSPSQMPKQGAMKKLGIEAKEVATWETTGTKLEVIATEGQGPG